MRLRGVLLTVLVAVASLHAAEPRSFIDYSTVRELVHAPESWEVLDARAYLAKVTKKDPDLAEIRQRFAQLFASTGVGRLNPEDLRRIEAQPAEKIPGARLIEQLTFERLAFVLRQASDDASWCREVSKAFQILYLVSGSSSGGLGYESADLALYLHYVLQGTRNFALPCRDDVNTDHAVISRLIGRSGVRDVRYVNADYKRGDHPMPIVVDSSSGAMKVKSFEPNGTLPESLPPDVVVVVVPNHYVKWMRATDRFRVTWGGKRVPGRNRSAAELETGWVQRWGK